MAEIDPMAALFNDNNIGHTGGNNWVNTSTGEAVTLPELQNNGDIGAIREAYRAAGFDDAEFNTLMGLAGFDDAGNAYYAPDTDSYYTSENGEVYANIGHNNTYDPKDDPNDWRYWTDRMGGNTAAAHSGFRDRQSVMSPEQNAHEATMNRLRSTAWTNAWMGGSRPGTSDSAIIMPSGGPRGTNITRAEAEAAIAAGRSLTHVWDDGMKGPVSRQVTPDVLAEMLMQNDLLSSARSTGTHVFDQKLTDPDLLTRFGQGTLRTGFSGGDETPTPWDQRTVGPLTRMGNTNTNTGGNTTIPTPVTKPNTTVPTSVAKPDAPAPTPAPTPVTLPPAGNTNTNTVLQPLTFTGFNYTPPPPVKKAKGGLTRMKEGRKCR